MYQEYHKEYSTHLEREMEFKVYGRGGKPVLVFPCQNGRFFDWEGFGMLVTLGDWLEREKIQLFCVDTIDSETLSNQRGDPCVRVRRHEAWFQYLVQELVPRIHQINPSGQDILTTGFSMGAYHAANCFFRRPCMGAIWTIWSISTTHASAWPTCRRIIPISGCSTSGRS